MSSCNLYARNCELLRCPHPRIAIRAAQGARFLHYEHNTVHAGASPVRTAIPNELVETRPAIYRRPGRRGHCCPRLPGRKRSTKPCGRDGSEEPIIRDLAEIGRLNAQNRRQATPFHGLTERLHPAERILPIRCHTPPMPVRSLKKSAFDLMTDPGMWLRRHLI